MTIGHQVVSRLVFPCSLSPYGKLAEVSADSQAKLGSLSKTAKKESTDHARKAHVAVRFHKTSPHAVLR